MATNDDPRIRHFAAFLREAGGELHELPGEGLAPWLLAHARESGGVVVLSTQPSCRPLCEELRAGGVDARLDEGWESDAQRIAALAAATAGVSAAAAGAADCGALLIVSGPGHGRALSLLPLEHILILHAADLREGLADCADVFGTPAAAVTIIGGPSKTADIEKVLVTGVHGPKRLIVLLIP